jgi:hypothetical protein
MTASPWATPKKRKPKAKPKPARKKKATKRVAKKKVTKKAKKKATKKTPVRKKVTKKASRKKVKKKAAKKAPARKRTAKKISSGDTVSGEVKVVRGVPYCAVCGKKCGKTEGRYGAYWACQTGGCLGRCPQERKSGWALPKPKPASFRQIEYARSLQEKAQLSDRAFKNLLKKITGKADPGSMSKREISAALEALKDAAVSKGATVRGRSPRGRSARAGEYKRGDKIVFGQPEGQKTLAVITSVRDQAVKARTLEERGHRKVRMPGGIWTVPYGLITRFATPEEVEAGRARQTRTRSPRRGRRRGGWGSPSGLPADEFEQEAWMRRHGYETNPTPYKPDYFYEGVEREE